VEQNEGMKKTLLFVLALIAVGCADAEQSETLSEDPERERAVEAEYWRNVVRDGRPVLSEWTTNESVDPATGRPTTNIACMGSTDNTYGLCVERGLTASQVQRGYYSILFEPIRVNHDSEIGYYGRGLTFSFDHWNGASVYIDRAGRLLSFIDRNTEIEKDAFLAQLVEGDSLFVWLNDKAGENRRVALSLNGASRALSAAGLLP